MLGLADFLGDWQLSRWIDDALDPRPARFEGRARFSEAGDALRYQESGLLILGDGPGLTAERTYFWNPMPGGIAVSFEDGRAFHSFTPDATAEATHWCDPDNYAVRYDFTRWPEWQSRWRVTGPRKDYMMHSSYRREA